MKVHLIKKLTIDDYVLKHANSRIPFEDWLSILKSADWNSTNDISATFNSADILGKDSQRIVFNIGGNNYRMICKYKFGRTMVHLSIRWIGTHAEYDKLCKKNEQYTANQF